MREVLLQFRHDGVGGAELALHGDEFASVFHRGLQGGFPEVGAFDAAAQVGERDVFLGSQHDEVAAGEVDPEVFLTAPGKEADGTEDEDGRESEGDVAFADEVDAARGDPVDHGQLLQSEVVEHEPENGAGEEQGGEHRGDDAEGQGDGEALDRAGGLPEKDGRGNERGDVGVENGGESFVISRIDGRPERFAGGHFLAQSFVDEHVGVDGHTDGQDDAGDTGKGEHEVEHAHRAEEQDEIHG